MEYHGEEKKLNGACSHKPSQISRHLNKCFDIEYAANNIGARYYKNNKRRNDLVLGKLKEIDH